MATSTPGSKKRSASQDLPGEDTKKVKLNNSTNAADEKMLGGETQSQGFYDEITKRNSEKSPLLRLPAELRIKIYQYALSGFILGPASNAVHRNGFSYAPVTCISLDTDCGSSGFGKDLWSMANSLSRSSRQLRAEIGETLFAESCLLYSARWRRWPPMLSKKQKDAVRHIVIVVYGRWSSSSPEICNFF
ncbi:hypothetical protein E8E13_005816 [Curvularia kusanoi]|uniref:Uncharacterized protein n=1 Tax=Curvularia kusanoi TaxID=90978 RepID=A0A9P4WAJ3_CURKU|nr:hypothetical protein E8E13_005816 [Curvularia kusanoi]